ncbi:zinc-finger domain-containing protein [Geopyxis carbonaria]|nr:zinc-finger domain-containing protein [Geopyxis carbonaria]
MTPLRQVLRRSGTARLPSLLRYSSTTQPTITKPNVPGTPNASATNEVPSSGDPATGSLETPAQSESVVAGEALRHAQAPNRAGTWSRSQRPRELGMVGPRFEQTILEAQPAPYAAIELIHQQPVRWTKERVVACDGGGGPNGHPRVFINVDKPQVEPCGYCGLPFAHVKNRAAVVAQGASGYALE